MGEIKSDTVIRFSLHIGIHNADQSDEMTAAEWLGRDVGSMAQGDIRNDLDEAYTVWRSNYLDGWWLPVEEGE